jgi:lysophospholipid acyltransferase (LPLAT)-like uncharacterized protein
MKKSVLSRYHVNEVPIILKPMFYLYGYGIPFVLFLYFLFVYLTSKIVITGNKVFKDNPNYIICFWHTFICLYFTVFRKNRHQVWLQHPTWYMKPSHVMLRFVGVKKIILGSSGHSGREAADELVNYLKKGYSTVILPDGPSGPPFKMKKGIFHIALQSNIPIVPIRFEATPCFVSPNWDHRRWPIPFSEIKVIVEEAIHITEENFESAYHQVSESLKHKCYAE